MFSTEQKSIIWDHYWARKGCQIGKHELQRRYEKYSDEKWWFLSQATLEPSIRNCYALFYQRWFAPSWMFIVTVKLDDGKAREFWRWISLTNPQSLACWSWLTGHPFLTELCELLTPIHAYGQYGRFQTAVCFGFCLWYIECCNLVFWIGGVPRHLALFRLTCACFPTKIIARLSFLVICINPSRCSYDW